MLSSALNFLSDRRKRFHRSDTMPAFTHDPNLFKLTNELPDLDTCPDSQQQQQQQEQTFHTYHSPNPTIRDDLIDLRIESGSNGDLASLSNRPNMFTLADERISKPKPNHLVRSRDLGGSDQDLTSQFKRDQESPTSTTGLSLANRNQEAKLKFLNLPVMGLSPHYGASNNSMLSYSRSGTDSSPTPSMISWNSRKSTKDDPTGPESDRELFKQSSLKVEHMETVVIGSSSLKENEPGEDLISGAMSGRNRVGRLQSKTSASRSVKNKVKRSKSTVHVSRRMKDTSREDMLRERASSAQRNPLDSVDDLKSAKMSDDSGTQGTKHATEKTSLANAPSGSSNVVNSNRSRSVMPHHVEQESVTIQDSKRNFELLMSLAKRGTKAFYYRINALDSMDPERTKTPDRGASTTENSGVQIPYPEKTKPICADNLSPTIHQSSSTSSSRLNRYAVVRRLRRNNSSITCTTEKTFRSFDEPVQPNSTCSVAGDLLLPSKKLNAPLFANRSITGLTQDKWISDLFQLAETNDLDRFLKQFEQFHLLARNVSAEAERLQNQYELNPLDCALLNGHVSLAIYLILCGFGPGPILQYGLKQGPPISKQVTSNLDTMRVHLNNLIHEFNARLLYAQEETKQTVEQANNLTQTIKLSKDSTTNASQMTNLNQIYAKVGLKEQALADNLAKQDQILIYSRNLDQYPVKTRMPRRVRLLLEGSQSILVRITPARSSGGLANPLDIVYNEKSSCSSSGDDEDNPDWLSEGRKVSVTCQSKLAPLVVLKYRIEWSHCPKFLNAPVYECTVEPVFYLHGISQCGDSIQVRNLNHLSPRTGFYLISNLNPGKMVFVRVYAFSVHGWSDPCYSQPPGINLSTWQECKAIASTSTQPQQRFVGDALVPEIDLQKQILVEKVVSWISGSHVATTSTNTTAPAGTSISASTPSAMPNSASVSSISSGGGATSVPGASNPQPGTIQTPTSGQTPSFDDTSKRNRSPMLQRKRSFRFLFSNKGFRFVKQVKSGLYLAVLCHTPIQNSTQLVSNTIDLAKQKYQLVLADDCLPTINVTREDVFTSSSSNLVADFNWFSKLVSDSSGDMDVQLLCEDAMRSNLPTNLQLRIRLFGALQRLRFLLGTANMGTVYPEMIRSKLIDPNLMGPKIETEDLGRFKVTTTGESNEATLNESARKTYSSAIIVLLRQVNSPNDVCLTSNLRWCSLDKFLKQNKIRRMDFMVNLDQSFYPIISNTERMMNQLLTHYSHLLSTRGDQLLLTPEAQIIANLDSLLYYSTHRTQQLEPGLYLALIQMQANLDQQATILVSNSSHALQMFPCQRVRQRSHVSREEWDLLFQILNCNSTNKLQPHQGEQCFEIRDTERRFIVKLMRAWFKLIQRLGFPRQLALQYRIYLPEIIRLSPHHAIIPCFPPVDQVCLRPGLITVTPPACYWIPMAHFERSLGLVYDPHFNPQLFHLMSLLELLIPISQFIQRQCFTDQELSLAMERTQSLQQIQSKLDAMMQGKRWLSETLAAGRDRKRMDYVTIEFEKVLKSFYSWLPGSILMFLTGSDSTGDQIQSDTDEAGLDKTPNIVDHVSHDLYQVPRMRDLHYFPTSKEKSCERSTSSIIQVYADYPSGLASGTYVRLLIYSKTTAREIIQIVTHQIKQTAQKHSIYQLSPEPSDSTATMDTDSESDEHSYCLTVSIGPIERPLSPQIRPLLLRHPWRAGKFAVRLASQVQLRTNQNEVSPANEVLNPYRISKKHAFKLTVVENPFMYAHVNLPPHILP